MGCFRSVEHDRARVCEATAESRSSTAMVRKIWRQGVLPCVHCSDQPATEILELRQSVITTKQSQVDESKRHPRQLTTKLYLPRSL